ncbi:hypothetical protein LEP1GSC041_3350 [Leptospira noguchii str. 2006001870]|uniref:Uncharacterized protein n=2 Tax=Leptospira noguchii TaxID=28182 RepID=T0FTE3_9LEPT|nr:hypothetical protein LEP1GSC041_3350 [Leptospira noguchii str. 2006001870]EMO53266.1 hypothetical protein LEP1GSC172_2655 [Leptospira noguchii]EQA73519.1 hypothetical protein LEP1GSC059_0338 [Leptospira noguchii serovar Panama str. CZ214]
MIFSFHLFKSIPLFLLNLYFGFPVSLQNSKFLQKLSVFYITNEM